MCAEYRLKTPLQKNEIRELKLGDLVYLDGEIVITAGLPTHQRIMECIDKRKDPPVDLKHAAFFHLGSYNREIAGGAYEVLYINPTTSTRFNPFMPTIIETFGLRAVGGKGGLDRESAKAMKKTGCVYLSFLGGGCPVFTESVRNVVSIGWTDLIFHYRLVKLKIERLGPLPVAIDSHGNSIYEQIKTAVEKGPGI